jgi:molybdopterin-guanine dinucleotide biosynthesis protein A
LTDVAGIFVGGSALRMGGRAKGLLPAPDGIPIVERWCAMLRARGVGVVLVGDAGAYAHLDLEHIADDPPGIGPLGGLVALLRRAGASRALAFACDMPFVTRELVERLHTAPSEAAILAPKRGDRWEPLCARYDPSRVLPLAVDQAQSSDHSLLHLLDRAGADTLPLTRTEEDQLNDWDSPADLTASRR